MSLTQFVLYLAAGRLLTWLAQVSGLMRPVWDRHPVLTELAGCDLCLGFWVYLLLAPRRAFGLWSDLGERVVLAAFSSLTAHLVRLGWGAKFGVTVFRG
jgi:hypothetical protein